MQKQMLGKLLFLTKISLSVKTQSMRTMCNSVTSSVFTKKLNVTTADYQKNSSTTSTTTTAQTIMTITKHSFLKESTTDTRN